MPRPTAPGQVVVSVADDGDGLPAEVAAAPFEPARRRRTPTSGAGLGLSIARGIVTAHGGRIELASPGPRYLLPDLAAGRGAAGRAAGRRGTARGSRAGQPG